MAEFTITGRVGTHGVHSLTWRDGRIVGEDNLATLELKAIMDGLQDAGVKAYSWGHLIGRVTLNDPITVRGILHQEVFSSVISEEGDLDVNEDTIPDNAGVDGELIGPIA